MADIVDEWEMYLSTSRTNTLGVHATNSCASGVSYVAGVADVADVVNVPRQTASSSQAALLFAYVLLRSVAVFCRFSMLQSVVEAMGFFVVVARYIGCIVRGCTVRASFFSLPAFHFCSLASHPPPPPTSEAHVFQLSFCSCSIVVARKLFPQVNVDVTWDDMYTGFTPGVPGGSHRCRLVRYRRYRAGTSGGLSRQAFRRAVASVHQFLTHIHPPPEPPTCRWTNKSVVCGAVYMASAVASALAYGSVTASIFFVAMVTWAAVGSVLFPVGHRETHAQAVGVGTPSTTRIGPDTYCAGGRRRVPCRGKTHRRYGRRMGSSGYLKKQLKKEKDRSDKKQERRRQRRSGVGLASVRGGAGPNEVRFLWGCWLSDQ